MMPHIVVYPDADALAWSVAEATAVKIEAATAVQGRAVVALAGGTTPRAIYAHWARLPIDWSRVTLVFGDERAVPPGDGASNYHMVDEALLSKLEVRPTVLRVTGEDPPELAAATYAQETAALELDLVLLGMGDDGHVASIFPGTLAEGRGVDGPAVLATTAPDAVVPKARVSLSLARLAHARALWMVVTGAAKAERLGRVWDQIAAAESGATGSAAATGGISPAAVIAGRVHAGCDFAWHVDRAAATALGALAPSAPSAPSQGDE